MRGDTHIDVLLRGLASEPVDLGFDPDSPSAQASLERILAEPPDTVGRRRRPVRRPLMLAAVPLVAAAAVVLVVASLGGSRATIAQAAVLTRAAAALDQTDSILELHVTTYSATGGGPCIETSGPPFISCSNSSSANAQTGISPDPSQDTPTSTYTEWISPDRTQDHTTYNNAYEAATDSQTNEYQSYDPDTNTILTLTDTTASAQPLATVGVPVAGAFAADPAGYEQLYQQAQADAQSTHGTPAGGETTVSTQLVGQTTIDDQAVYELRFTMHLTPPQNPPPGDICGTTVCSPPDREDLLYLNTQTFLPVRSVTMLVNPDGGHPGIAPGTNVYFMTDLTIQTLPNTTANQALLALSPHPGATQATETETQYRAALKTWISARAAANAANSRREPPPHR